MHLLVTPVGPSDRLWGTLTEEGAQGARGGSRKDSVPTSTHHQTRRGCVEGRKGPVSPALHSG